MEAALEVLVVLIIISLLFPWTKYAYLSLDCSTTWLKHKQGRIIAAVPVFVQRQYGLFGEDKYNHYQLNLIVSLDEPSCPLKATETEKATMTCAFMQISRHFYDKHTAEIASSAMIGNMTTVVQSYWRPDSCFDLFNADTYFGDNFERTSPIILGGALYLWILAFFIVLPLESFCLPNLAAKRAGITSVSRPTFFELLNERTAKERPGDILTILVLLMLTAVLCCGMVCWITDIKDHFMLYHPRFLTEEIGWIQAATPALVQPRGFYSVVKDDPNADFYIDETVRLLMSNSSTCNFQRKTLLFKGLSKAAIHAADRIGANVTVWRSKLDPTVCSDGQSSNVENEVGFLVVFLGGAVCSLWKAWKLSKGCFGLFSDGKEQQNEELVLTITDKYARFQAECVKPKPKMETFVGAEACDSESSKDK